MDSTCFRFNIKHLRKSGKMTQTAFGELLELSKGTISSYEGGKSTPSFSDLVKIRNILEIDLDSLIISDLSGSCPNRNKPLSQPIPKFGENEINPFEVERENTVLKKRLEQKEQEILNLLFEIDELKGEKK